MRILVKKFTYYNSFDIFRSRVNKKKIDNSFLYLKNQIRSDHIKYASQDKLSRICNLLITCTNTRQSTLWRVFGIV